MWKHGNGGRVHVQQASGRFAATSVMEEQIVEALTELIASVEELGPRSGQRALHGARALNARSVIGLLANVERPILTAELYELIARSSLAA